MGQLVDRRTALLAITATVVSVERFSALAQGVDPGLKPDEARALAQEAWVFGMPLVYIEKQIDVLTHVTKPQGPLAPINQFAHYREFPDASNKIGRRSQCRYALLAWASSTSRKDRWSCPFRRWAIDSG